MKPFRKYNKYILCCLIYLSFMATSCSAGGEMVESEGGKPVRLSASISQTSVSRGYQASGDVDFGTYYLTYSNPLGTPQYNVATVNFYDATGFITTPEGDELSWNKVGFDPGSNQNQATFYLDNVTFFSETGDVSDILLPEDNPYKAGKFDYETGSNDLLWGKMLVEREVTKVPIQLHHSMAMIRVIITVDASGEASIAPDLRNASVELTNIISSPKSYDRLNGALDLGSEPLYSDLTLVSPETNEWNNIETSGPNDGITTYTASDFVLPPQNPGAGEFRSRLRVILPQADGSQRVFSGFLPRAMLIENADGSTVSENFSFKREHILTLEVTMDPDSYELEFMPVTVIDWVNKGSYTLTGAQAAIYDESDFMKMIEYYDSENWKELERYGFKKNDTWIFNIYGDLTFSESTIKDQMPVKEGNPYQFIFNGQTVTIILSDSTSLILNRDNNNEEYLSKILQGEEI